MHSSRPARNVVIVLALAYLLGAGALMAAQTSGPCRWTSAVAADAVGDRYRTARDFPTAIRSYVTATRLVRGCKTVSGLRLSLRSLAQLTGVYVQDYFVRTLWWMSDQQARLADMASSDVQAMQRAALAFNVVERVKPAIDQLTRSTSEGNRS